MTASPPCLIMPWPSKDPNDYEPGGAGWLGKPEAPPAPTRIKLAAAITGLAAGAGLGVLLGLGAFATAGLISALSQLAVDAWWRRPSRRREPA
jgi:hypothetical protein